MNQQQVKETFLDEFPDEASLVKAIRNLLLTESQGQALREAGLTIEDCLNGRFGDSTEGLVLSTFLEWNGRLGFKCFGF